MEITYHNFNRDENQNVFDSGNHMLLYINFINQLKITYYI